MTTTDLQSDSLHCRHRISRRERELSELYWRLQRRVHTEPKIRPYAVKLGRLLRELLIPPSVVNDIGLELAHQNRI